MSDSIASTPLIVSSAPPERPRLERPRTGAWYALVGYVLSLVAVFVVHFVSRFWALEENAAIATLERATVVAASVAFGASVVLWVRWQLRAARNARAMTRETPRFSPAWSVGCFFVPFVHLVLPLFAVTEIWNASHGHRLDRRPVGLLVAWWVGCLAPTLFFGLSFFLDGGSIATVVGVASVAAYPAAALLAALVVARVNARQRAAKLHRG